MNYQLLRDYNLFPMLPAPTGQKYTKPIILLCISCIFIKRVSYEASNYLMNYQLLRDYNLFPMSLHFPRIQDVINFQYTPIGQLRGKLIDELLIIQHAPPIMFNFGYTQVKTILERNYAKIFFMFEKDLSKL